jgi:hypothetical protein
MKTINQALRASYVAHLNAPTLAKIKALESAADVATDQGDHAKAGRLILTADNFRLLLVQD